MATASASSSATEQWSGIWWSDKYPKFITNGNVYVSLPMNQQASVMLQAKLKYLGLYLLGQTKTIPIRYCNGKPEPVKHESEGFSYGNQSVPRETGLLSFIVTKRQGDTIEGNWILDTPTKDSGKFQLWKGPSHGNGDHIASAISGAGSTIKGWFSKK